MKKIDFKSLNTWQIIASILTALTILFLSNYFYSLLIWISFIITIPVFLGFLVVMGVLTYSLFFKKYVKKKKALVIYSLILFIYVVFYFFIINYDIGPVEDDTFLKIMCKLNPETEVVVSGGSYGCKGEHYHIDKYLKKWNGYHGCNESTKGYRDGYIGGIESCELRWHFNM